MIARRWFTIAAAVGLAGYAAQVSAQPADLAKLREELMAMETASWGYMRDKNLDGMRGYLADDGLLIFADGSRYDKRETLALMPDFKLDSFAIEPGYTVRMVSADVATLLYRVTYTASVKGGRAETVKALSSNVYVRRDGKWWSVLYQESPIK